MNSKYETKYGLTYTNYSPPLPGRLLAVRETSLAERHSFDKNLGIWPMQGYVTGLSCLDRQLLPSKPDMHYIEHLAVIFLVSCVEGVTWVTA